MNDARAREILTGLLTHLRLPFEGIEVTQEDGLKRLAIRSPVPSRLIGWHGETLSALQQIFKILLHAKEGDEKTCFMVLDVDGYRRDQEEKVRQAAIRKAEFVRKTGNRVTLPPMSPYFRRVVHLHVANNSDLQDITTASAGEGEYRHIVLRLKDEHSGAPPEGEELSPVLEDADDLGNLDV